MMIALAILTIGILSMVNSFGFIQKAIQASKNKTLASNLAQEKMQILKQKVYYQVLVTSDPAHNTTDFAPQTVDYDTGYFPPEIITEAGVTYTRYTLVEVAREDSGKIVVLSPSTPDTGMRLLTVTVAWAQGASKRKLALRSVIANPDTVMSNAVFSGLLRDSVSLAPIEGALVNIAENMGWRDTTNLTGNYAINAAPGNFNIVATADGYYTQVRNVSITANQTQTQNFDLQKIATGTVNGAAWFRDHLVISLVVGSTINSAGYDQEYVEIFNPTTWTWTVNGDIGLKFQRYADGSKREIQINYLRNTIPSAGYYLFANTGTVRAVGANVNADAVWDSGNSTSDFPYFSAQDNIIPVFEDGGGEGCAAIELYRDSDNFVLDQVGWNRNNDSKTAPFYETSPYSQGVGLERTETYARYPSTSGANSAYGPAYDSNNNNVDIYGLQPAFNAPHNSLSAVKPVIAGTPAAGAVVTASDGLSGSAQAVLTGAIPSASFTLIDVATGTWTVVISSGQYMLENDTVTVPTAGSVYTFPSSSTVLNQTATQGIITGRVLNSAGVPIASPSAILVSPGSAGAQSPASTADGRYRLMVSPGIVDVTANPGNNNGNYVSISSLSIPIAVGEVHSGVDFFLYQGGRISGFITRDGINALPGVAVALIDVNGLSRDQQVSGIDGKFTSISIPTGTYTAAPAVGSLEQANPSTTTVLLTTAGTTKFSSTFTITGALGYITGTVKFGGLPIKTGVLLVVTTSTLSGTPPAPPALSAATLSGSPYYLVSSLEDGTYKAEVRQSTSPKYNVYAYYPSPSGTFATMISSAASNVSVLAGQITTGVNFSW
jgi:hypothetical protein